MIQEPELSVVEKFLMLKRAGFDGVELKTTEKVDHDEVLAAISKNGAFRSWNSQCVESRRHRRGEGGEKAWGGFRAHFSG